MFFKSLRFIVSMACFSVSVDSLDAQDFLFPDSIRNAKLNPIFDDVTVPKKFVWESSVLDAFTKAVDSHRPLILIFTNSAKKGEVTLSTRFIAELEVDGLAKFSDKAVFINVAFSDENSALQDAQGIRILKLLKITDVPTVSFIAPNIDAIAEGFRIEGYFPIEKVKEEMAKGIDAAMARNLTFCPSSPAELVLQLNEACQAGNLEMYAACFSGPVYNSLHSLHRTQREVGNAKRQMLKAIEAFFGVEADRMQFVDDDEMRIRELREVTKIESLESLKASTSDSKIHVPMAITKLHSDGSTQVVRESYIAVEDRFGWRLLAPEAQQLVKSFNKRETSIKTLALEFDRITKEVVNGKYGLASEASESAKLAYEASRSDVAVGN